MKSAEIISRISRVIDTFGKVNFGAELAKEYSEAINTINSRLDLVISSIESNQISEAVRILEDSPRLLDEIAILNFNRLSEWKSICLRQNWEVPAEINRNIVERILLFYESKEVVEPLLRMYRKAMLTNNLKQIVSCLRRLAECDNAQNWKQNLLQSEKQLQIEFVKEFSLARKTDNKSELDRIAQEFVENDWLEPKANPEVAIIFNYIAEEKLKSQKIEAAENLSILNENWKESWKREIVQSMLNAIDVLVEQGWNPTTEELELISKSKIRCAKEVEEEEKEKRWKDLCSNLHSAIQRENVVEIRNVLASPEFLDREPDPDLVRQAKLVILHHEETQKRKTRQLVVCAIIFLFAILGVSGWWLQRKLFNDQCEMQATKLAALHKGPHSIERMSSALSSLKKDNPKVFKDPRVNIYNDKLNTLREETLVRTNTIVSIIDQIKEQENVGWENEDFVTNGFFRVQQLLTQDDEIYKVSVLELENSWLNFKESQRLINVQQGTQTYNNLIARIEQTLEELNKEPMKGDLLTKVNDIKKSISNWKDSYSINSPSLAASIIDYEKQLHNQEAIHKNLQNLISTLNSAESASEYLKQRQLILEHYSMYQFVNDELDEYPITINEIISLKSKTSAAQKKFYDEFHLGIPDEQFKSFISGNVLIFKEFPAFYSLYGVYFKGGDNFCHCVSKGKPEFKKPDYGSSFLIEGELVNFGKNTMVQHLSVSFQPLYKPLLPTEEIVSIVDFASMSTISQASFEKKLLRLISNHINAVNLPNQSTFLNEEVNKNQTRLSIDRFPAICRVQYMALYLNWLRYDLKKLPSNDVYINEFKKIDELAQPVSVDGISKDLSWTCFHERRVRERNAECAKLLIDLHKNKFIEKIYGWKKTTALLSQIYHWDIKFVGSIKYDPYNLGKENAKTCDVKIEIGKPLYVLRNEEGKTILKRALIPSKKGSKTRWQFVNGMSSEIMIGEPLFSINESGEAIDAEKRINEILNKIPEYYSKKVADRIPLFNVNEE